jgi:hypothetical protein
MTAAAFDRGDALAERRLGALPRPRGSVKGLWVAAYCLAAVLPLAAVLVSSPPGGRGLVVELASALGSWRSRCLPCSWWCRRGFGWWPGRWVRRWRSVCIATWPMWWWPRSRPTWRW